MSLFLKYGSAYRNLLSNTDTHAHKLLELWPRLCAAVNPNTVFWLVMPIPYSLDLRWRIIWIGFAWHAIPQYIGQQLSVSERTMRRYLKMFKNTGDVKPHSHRSGPLRLFGDYEQLTLLRLILENPTWDSTTILYVWCGCQCFYNLQNPEIGVVARKYSI